MSDRLFVDDGDIKRYEKLMEQKGMPEMPKKWQIIMAALFGSYVGSSKPIEKRKEFVLLSYFDIEDWYLMKSVALKHEDNYKSNLSIIADKNSVIDIFQGYAHGGIIELDSRINELFLGTNVIESLIGNL